MFLTEQTNNSNTNFQAYFKIITVEMQKNTSY